MSIIGLHGRDNRNQEKILALISPEEGICDESEMTDITFNES